MKNKEIWKCVKGYSNYKVSNKGRIKRLEYVDSNNRLREEIVLKLSTSGTGYLHTKLCKNKKYKEVRIHRVVAENFIPNLEDKLCVHHIDGNKQNNCVENLKWVSHSENTQIAVKENKMNTRKVICIDTGKIYDSIKEASKKLQINNCSIGHCCNGRIVKAGGYKWSYADNIKIPTYSKKYKRKVICIDTGKIYDSIKEASKETGSPSTGISACCRGVLKTTKKMKWKYL